jgi:c-di-GMP-related signal transduction protein
MASQPTDRSHIETTELLVRLYVFLAQYLDRCINATAHQSYPESELKKHLAETRAKLSEILSVNRVVKNKVEQECDRVLSLGAACLKGTDKTVVDAIKSEQTVLRNKTIALSDLLAVFRAV